MQTKQNSKIQLISSTQNSLKTVAHFASISVSFEAENMYCTDTDCTNYIVRVPYGLYEFSYHCKHFSKKTQKFLSNSVQLTTLNVVRNVPPVVFYAFISMLIFLQKSLLQLTATNFSFRTFLQLSASFLQSVHEE